MVEIYSESLWHLRITFVVTLYMIQIIYPWLVIEPIDSAKINH